jgi:hypothetical protein
LLQKDLHTLFDEHKVNEASYMKKLQAYQKTYLEFQDDSPSATPKDSFDTLDFN